MKQIHIFFASLFVLLTSGMDAQVNTSTDLQQKHTKKELEFSLFMGRSYGGPLPGIRESMLDAGLIEPSSDQEGSFEYPMIKKRVPFYFELKLNANQRSGVAFRIGRDDALFVSAFPDVKCRLRDASLNYVYSLGNNRHEFSAGPSLLALNLKSNDHISGNTVKRKMGLNIGYSFHFIETKGFFMAFHTHYTWAGHTTIGPYTLHADGYDWVFIIIPIHQPGVTAQIPATKVNLNTFDVGFSVGFRFGDDAGVVSAKN